MKDSYYILYAERVVSERCIVKAKNEDEAIEIAQNEEWESDQDVSWEIVSITKENK